jgi:multidrug resistance efflux pump
MTTEERIAKLEAKIDTLQAKQATLHQQLNDAQVEQWQARIDDLEVQVHLATMEANDRLTPMLDQLRNTWLDAKTQLEGRSETATAVAETLRTGLESAYRDLRTAVLTAKSKVSS